MKRGRLTPRKKVNMAAPEEVRGRKAERLLDPFHPLKSLFS